MHSFPARIGFLVGWMGVLVIQFVVAHDHTAEQATRRRQAADRREIALAKETRQAELASCQLTVRIREVPAQKPLPGLLRITSLTTGKPLALSGEIHRDQSWYSVRPQSTVAVPQGRIRLEAIHGLETERAVQEVDLSGKTEHTVDLQLTRIADPRTMHLRSGNTHLHLMKMSYPEALNYLQIVPPSDGLDLVYLSHLRRIPDERDYISNRIVENSFSGGDLQRLSQQGVLFGNGQEHRHNFGRGGEGFGHVMLLDLQRLIHPVSIGPGIMAEGTDSQPLRQGIEVARRDGATVVWCHNTFGYEDLPNWASGLLHAQNIFDGGDHGSYRDTYYRYLNLGWRVPFSTGTDWFIYDFSRVYVPVAEGLTSARWLAALRDGRSYITNGPLLEFQVNGRPIGDTLALTERSTVTVRGRALGRNSFGGLELIHNGEVIQTAGERASGGHFTAELDQSLRIDGPGWLALRIPLEAGRNEFERPQFAHTSAVYIEFAGRRMFRPEIARQLVSEMEQDLEEVRKQATFASPVERESVERVYRDGMTALRRRLSEEQEVPIKKLILPGESFLVEGRPAFVLLPAESLRQKPQPWVFYAPTLPGYPDQHEKWMHEQFLAAGVAVAGIDAGEAYGSPRGQQLMTALYRELTEQRGFSQRPCLLGRSRGGLWVSSWAISHPEKVAGLAGIYPVFDLRSYPGVAKAAAAYELSAAQLESRLPEFNPIARIDVLAKARVPVCIIHGDDDKVVPLKENSGTLADRYRQADVPDLVKLMVAEGQGHNFWEGFFRCQELVDFAIRQAKSGSPTVPQKAATRTKKPDPVDELAAKLEPAQRTVYKTVGSRELSLHVFRPDGWKPGDRRSCFVIFHGGGWTGGEPRRMYPFADHFAGLGMVGISVEYRLLNARQGTTVFDCVRDGRSAVRFIRIHAASLGVDPQRIIVSGGSAGGHVAAGTALFDGVDEPGEPTDVSCVPNALVLLFPVIDTSTAGYGNAKIGERWRELSPVHQVRGVVPPTILFHGTADTVTPFAGAQAFHNAMLKQGNRCEFVVHDGGRHGYLMFDRQLYLNTLSQAEQFLTGLGFEATR